MCFFLLVSAIDFVDSAAKAREVIKSRLLGLVLSASGAKARKSLNGDFWD